jgi:phospholipase/lecithinase/hemolysin
LYSVGLRKFLLAGMGPLGCIPWLRASGLAPQQGQCVDQVNRMVGFFNQGLRSLVDQLNADYPDAAFTFGNTYDGVQDVIRNPSDYGFTVVDSGCCGLGNNRVQVTCVPFVQPCDDRDQYFFWDAYHPTQAANLVLAQKVFNGTQEHVYLLNIKQLSDI